MQTIDLKKQFKGLYTAKVDVPARVDVPPLPYLMIDGTGDPNTAPAFQEAIQMLYSLSYTMKFEMKKAREIDYPVMALEGLWWMEGMAKFDLAAKDDWLWTLMILLPEVVTPELMAWAAGEIERKKGLAAVRRARLETYHEGVSAQILHVGPFSEEGPTVARLHAFIAAQECAPAGKHHEIYFSDARRVPPEKWRTIIRQPMR
jgi:hypothetical protein